METHKYCPNCGQKTIDKVEWGNLRQILMEGMSFDRGFFYNIKVFFTEGGEAVNRYVSGQTRKFQNPLLYFLTCFGLLLLISSLTQGLVSGDFVINNPDGTTSSMTYTVSGPDEGEVRKMYFMLIVFIIPIIGIVLYLFSKFKRTLTHSILAAVYLMSSATLIYTLTVLLARGSFPIIVKYFGFYDAMAIRAYVNALLISIFGTYFIWRLYGKTFDSFLRTLGAIVILGIGVYLIVHFGTTTTVTEN